jgi:beta-lactamase class A
MSVCDLVVAMLTISDNAATDELVAIVGLDEINRIVSELGLGQTVITADLRQTLDAVARDVGLRDYQTLVAHQPSIDWRPWTRKRFRGIVALNACMR